MVRSTGKSCELGYDLRFYATCKGELSVILVQDVMTQNPLSVPQDAAVDVAIDLIVEQNISGVPVVDDEGRLVGLITEYDVLQLYGQQSDPATRYQSCRDLMTSEVCTIGLDASVEAAAKIFCAATMRRLLVVDGKQLVGVLSRRDVVRSIRDKRLSYAQNL